jgi:plastocyanin
MRRQLALLASFVVVPVALFACGDDDSAPGPKDAGPAVITEASMGADTSLADAAGDTAVASVIGQCHSTDFDAPMSMATGGDYTSATSVAITFPTGGAPAQYTNRCIKVKVGTVVTFTGNFSAHPLEQNGGDTPTPIPTIQSTNPGTDGGDMGSLPLTFGTAGTYGFECNFHPSIMFGAVEVVP